MTTTTETLREACPRCDRPRAPMAELTRRFREAADSNDPTPWTQHVAAFEAEHSDECVSYPSGSCSGRPVDWRQRALDAESRLRTLTTEAAAGTGGEPTDEEVEKLAEQLFAAARNRWIWNSRNAETKDEWRCAAREAWRLGARAPGGSP